MQLRWRRYVRCCPAICFWRTLPLAPAGRRCARPSECTQQPTTTRCTWCAWPARAAGLGAADRADGGGAGGAVQRRIIAPCTRAAGVVHGFRTAGGCTAARLRWVHGVMQPLCLCGCHSLVIQSMQHAACSGCRCTRMSFKGRCRPLACPGTMPSFPVSNGAPVHVPAALHCTLQGPRASPA